MLLGVVRRGETWQREFIHMSLQQKPNFGAATTVNPHPDAGAAREPDAKVLNQIYRHELLWWCPKAGA